MDLPSNVQKIAFLADYIPRKCGIATFTADLRAAIAVQYPGLHSSIIAVTDNAEGYDYPPEVRFEIPEQDISAYRRAADFLNLTNMDVLCLQHEFGIFGGPSGRHVLTLLRNLRMPVVTTLHTILSDPTDEQKRVLQEVIKLSARVVSMAEKGVEFLRNIYGTPTDKIDLIPHGIPDVPFADPNYYKDKFGVEGRPVLLTFGLLSPNKGIEFVLNALPAVVRDFPKIVYIVLGATHPNLVRDHGETYRLSLERLAKKNGVEKNVIFFNRFVDKDELLEFLGATDIRRLDRSAGDHCRGRADRVASRLTNRKPAAPKFREIGRRNSGIPESNLVIDAGNQTISGTSQGMKRLKGMFQGSSDHAIEVR